MKDFDWKAFGIMVGVAVGVYAIGEITTQKVIYPALAKAKDKKAKKDASKSDNGSDKA